MFRNIRRRIDFVCNEEEWKSEASGAYKISTLEIIVRGMERSLGGRLDFHASLHDDRVMKIVGPSCDYSNEISNKIPTNQPP